MSFYPDKVKGGGASFKNNINAKVQYSDQNILTCSWSCRWISGNHITLLLWYCSLLDDAVLLFAVIPASSGSITRDGADREETRGQYPFLQKNSSYSTTSILRPPWIRIRFSVSGKLYWVALTTSKKIKSARCKRVIFVTELFDIAVNDFDAKKSALYSWVFIVILTQCSFKFWETGSWVVAVETRFHCNV